MLNRLRRSSLVMLVGLSITAGAGAPAVAASAAAGTWTLTGSMHLALDRVTLTTLFDGAVLAAGGEDGYGSAQSNAQIYNATTGIWHRVSPMTAIRVYHTATLLFNGAVLVAGGCCDATLVNNLASAEIYDPHARTWTPTGSMSTPRIFATATRLLDGRVLVAGGCGIGNCYPLLASAEIFDPRTGTFIATQPMLQAREYHSATLLQDGSVLVAGGYGGACCNHDLNSAEIWNPRTGAWADTGSLVTAREQAVVTRLDSGQVLIAGGCGDAYCNLVLASAEIFNPRTRVWTATGAMHAGRVGFTSNLILGGMVVAAGGFGGGNTTDIYDPLTGTWTAAAPMNQSRYYDASAVLKNGRVIVAGGIASCSVFCSDRSSAELFS